MSLSAAAGLSSFPWVIGKEQRSTRMEESGFGVEHKWSSTRKLNGIHLDMHCFEYSVVDFKSSSSFDYSISTSGCELATRLVGVTRVGCWVLNFRLRLFYVRVVCEALSSTPESRESRLGTLNFRSRLLLISRVGITRSQLCSTSVVSALWPTRFPVLGSCLLRDGLWFASRYFPST